MNQSDANMGDQISGSEEDYWIDRISKFQK
jgi:hypothetical protein